MKVFKLLKLNIFIILLIISVFFILECKIVRAADLSFSTPSGSYQINDTFILNVLVSSSDQPINAVSAIISFPADKLEVVTLSKDASIINVWTRDPSFFNQLGKIDLEGVILTPGFQGSAGKIITIKFRVKKAGIADLVFSSGAILANDGLATNVTKEFKNLRLVLGNLSIEQTTQEALVADLPPLPKIYSSTHLDSNKWYADKNPKFGWVNPVGINGLRFSYDKNSKTTPNIIYSKLISSQEFKNIGDGIWYFHLQFRNEKGWGPVAHFRFQIDTQPPRNFSIRTIETDEINKYQPVFIFETTDDLSGVYYYKVRIDQYDYKVAKAEDVEGKAYNPGMQSAGSHKILVKAFDYADNSVSASKEFSVEELIPPIIIDYPLQLKPDDVLTIIGQSAPETEIKIWLQYSNESPQNFLTRSKVDGFFNFVFSESLKVGDYKLWAEAIYLGGSVSEPSNFIKIPVAESTSIKIGKLIIDYMSLIVTLLAIITLFLAIIFSLRKKIKHWQRRINEEVDESQQGIREAFNYLRQEMEKQISKLDGQAGLSEKEKELYESMKKSLEISESMIAKEVKDIEKEIK